MEIMEPKSGKLMKFGHGIFGIKWTEKWVHLDGHILKYFSMASEQERLFFLSSAGQSTTVDLMSYDFVIQDDKRITKKYAFHLIPKNKAIKSYIFACGTKIELEEWKAAFQARLSNISTRKTVPNRMAELLRHASEVFSHHDPRHTDKIDTSKLRLVLHSIGWSGDSYAFSLLQQQLDPQFQGKIARDQFLDIMKLYYASATEESINSKTSLSSIDPAVTTPRTSLSEPIKLERNMLHEEANQQNINDENNHSISDHIIPSEPQSNRSTSHECDATIIDWNEEYRRIEWSTIKDTSTEFSNVSTHALEMAAFLKKFRLTAENVAYRAIEEVLVTSILKTTNSKLMNCEGDHFLSTEAGEDIDSPTLKPIYSHCTKFIDNGLIAYIIPLDSRGRRLHKILGNEIRAARALHDAIATVARQERNGDSQIGRSATIVAIPLQCSIDMLGFRAYIVAPPSEPASTLTSLRSNLKLSTVTKKTMQRNLKDIYDELGLQTESLRPPQGIDRGVSMERQIPPFFSRTSGFSELLKNTLYIHNVADVFPDDSLNAEITDETPCKFRPEFVKRFGDMLPLHSNAHFSQVLSTEHVVALESQLLLQAAVSASEHLRQVVVPTFVQRIESNEIRAYESQSLTQAMHNEGINVRYLGLCYNTASLQHTKRLFLSELIARVCKNELRESLMDLLNDIVGGELSMSNELRTSDNLHKDIISYMHERSRCLIVEFFNLVLGVRTDDSRLFWVERIIPRMRREYFSGWMDSNGDPRMVDALIDFDEVISGESVHLPQLFYALQYHTNYDFSVEWKGKSDIASLTEASLGSIVPIINLLARSSLDCEKLVDHVNELAANGNFSEAIMYMKIHVAILDTAPRDERSLPLCHLLTCISELCLQQGLVDDATQYTELAIEVAPHNHMMMGRARLIEMKCHHFQTRANVADECPTIDERSRTLFNQAVSAIQSHFGSSHPLLFDTYMTMIEIAMTCHDDDLAFELWNDTVLLVKDCYGKTSMHYADTRRQHGESLCDANRCEEAISVLEEAVRVYERLTEIIKSDTRDNSTSELLQRNLAMCLYLIASMQARNVDDVSSLEAAYSTAQRSYTIRREILDEYDPDLLNSTLQLGSLARELGDSFRAMEYYRPAHKALRVQHATSDDVDTFEQLRSLTLDIAHLHLQAISAEQLNIVEKSKKRFATHWPRFDTSMSTNIGDVIPDGHSGTEQKLFDPSHDAYYALLAFAIKQLMTADPVDVINMLIDRTNIEVQETRRQIFLGSVSMESHVPSRTMQSPSSRFASFSIGQSSSSPQSPYEPSITPNSPCKSTHDSSVLKNNSGDYTYGAQLAAVVYLQEKM